MKPKSMNFHSTVNCLLVVAVAIGMEAAFCGTNAGGRYESTRVHWQCDGLGCGIGIPRRAFR